MGTLVVRSEHILNIQYSIMHPLRRYTIPCLLVGEVPTLIFTIFDILKLFSAYRGSMNRPYPSLSEIYSVIGIYTRNVIIILMMAGMGMEFFIRSDMVPYDMSDDIVFVETVIQLIQVSLFTEFLFYWLHRCVHFQRKLYYWMHVGHHKWRSNSFALVNHDLAIPEVGFFALCPAIPCIVLGVHWKVLLLHAMYTNWQGIYSHSGYRFPMLDLLLLTDSRDHDNHHKHPTYNFAGGGWYSVMDRIFGTYRLI